jgi:hypothetical protein
MSVLVIAMLSLATLQFVGSGCGETENEHIHVSNRNSLPIGSARLESYVERQKYGFTSGAFRYVNYYVFSDYDGSTRVLSIRTDLRGYVQYKRKTGENFAAGLDIGEKSGGVNVEKGEEHDYVDLEVRYSVGRSNGDKFLDYKSNYSLFPYDQVNYHGFENRAVLRLSGETADRSIAVGI